MDGKNLMRISFQEMNEIFKEASTGSDYQFFMDHGVAIGYGTGGVLRGVLGSPVPFLVEEGRIMLLEQGEMEVTINLINHSFSAGTLLYVGSGSIVQIRQGTPDVKMKGIMFSDEMLNIALDGNLPTAFCGQERMFRLTLTDDDRKIVRSMWNVLWEVVQQKEFNRQVVMAQLKTLAHYCDWLHRVDSNTATSLSTREYEIFKQFISLVNANCQTERLLSFYADRMCMSERYLGTMVHKASGITAKEWIDKAVITTAKVMLCHTNKPIARIADELNFATDSFFCKYFHRLTSTSPRAYRQEFATERSTVQPLH